MQIQKVVNNAEELKLYVDFFEEAKFIDNEKFLAKILTKIEEEGQLTFTLSEE